MDSSELNRISEWIVTDLEGREDITVPQKIELIKPALIELSSDSMKVGRTQILNHLKDEIKGLESS
ncbi:hypothetical protein KAR91_70490 [Candidatus Pacearchaeota archaeon]|nr:hypothetical protein [Candidatus Pacearchaeota archaeon]